MKCPQCGTEEYYISLFASGGKGECVNLYCEHYSADHAAKVQSCQKKQPLPDVGLDYDDLPETDPGGWQEPAKNVVEDLIKEILDDKSTSPVGLQKAVYRASWSLLWRPEMRRRIPRSTLLICPRPWIAVRMCYDRCRTGPKTMLQRQRVD